MNLTFKHLSSPWAEKTDKYYEIKNSLIEVNPGNAVLPPQYQDIAQNILDAPIYKDDIWLLSYPRTGSTWTQEMIWLMTNDFDYEQAKTVIQHIRTPVLELSAILVNIYNSFMDSYGNSVDFVNNLSLPRCVKSHLPLELLPRQYREVKPKTIYVVRNPKDVCVSYYHLNQLVHNMKATFEEFAELFINDKAPYGSYLSHYLGYWQQRHELNIHFIRYEDMKQDLKTVIRKTATFLEKPITNEQIEKLIEFLSFKNMKNNPAVNLKPILDEKNKSNTVENGEDFIRKGQIGDWKNYMTPELSKQFDEWTEKNLKGTGLSFD